MSRKFKVGDLVTENYTGDTYRIIFVEPMSYVGSMAYQAIPEPPIDDPRSWFRENEITAAPQKKAVYTLVNPTAWALQDKATGDLEKLFLFESRKDARKWAKDGNGQKKWKPVRVELKIIPGR